MSRLARDRITVELGALRARLFEQARREGVRPSDFVRRSLSRVLESPPEEGSRSIKVASTDEKADQDDRVRVTIRMTRENADELVRVARLEGLAPGDYVAGLLRGVAVLTAGGSRPDHLAALAVSSAELSTLSRNMHRLTDFLRARDAKAAAPYRDMLDTLEGDVRAHLALAADALKELEPRSPRRAPSKHGRPGPDAS